jgi:HK97 family phage prohead protease
MPSGARKAEIRVLAAAQLRIERRAAGDAEQRVITGYAATFNTLSDVMLDFRERIQPGAFDRTLKRGPDVRALVNHRADLLLGRTKSGTLRLEADAQGLRFELTPPNTMLARDTIESIERGDLDGMSFAFRTVSDDWHVEEGQTIRELLEVDLDDGDVSFATYPIYPDTEIALRSRDEFLGQRRVARELAARRRRRQQLAELEP